MKKLLAKIERIRASGWAYLDLNEAHPLYYLDGKRYKIQSIGTPDIKCRVTLIVEGGNVDFTIDDLH